MIFQYSICYVGIYSKAARNHSTLFSRLAIANEWRDRNSSKELDTELSKKVVS